MRALLSCSCILALTACGAPSGGADGGVGPGDAPVAPDAPALLDAGAVTPPPLPYYEVPTSDPALAAHVFFAVPDVHYVSSGGIVTLTYDFPPDLSGVPDQEVVFTGPVDAAGNATLSGATGTGSCVAAGNVVRCTEVFSTGLRLDAASALATSAGYSADPGVRAARDAVIQTFITDPIGIVVFDLTVASEPSGGGG